MPDGSAETFERVDWIGCNLEYAPAQWNDARARAASKGVKVMPWVRLAHVAEHDWEHLKTQLALLVTTAQVWGADTILPNYEDEADTFAPADVADHLYNVLDWDGQTGWSTQAWLPNDPDFTALNRDPVLLQIFPTDAGWEPWQIETKLGDCVEHARAKGFAHVGVTYQTYADATPGWYDCGAFCHSTFPGNSIGSGQWGAWYP